MTDPRIHPVPPSHEELAAWLDGRLEEAARDALELRIADCPDALAAIRDARAILADLEHAPHPAPATLARARALVEDAPTILVARRLRWLVAAAAVVGFALLGYRAGRAAAPAESHAGSALVGEITFGILGDGLAEEELTLLADAIGEEIS